MNEWMTSKDVAEETREMGEFRFLIYLILNLIFERKKIWLHIEIRCRVPK